jgi:ribonuclease PH
MNDAFAFIELQGTAEGHAFRKEELDQMLELAKSGIQQLMEKQQQALENC